MGKIKKDKGNTEPIQADLIPVTTTETSLPEETLQPLSETSVPKLDTQEEVKTDETDKTDKTDDVKLPGISDLHVPGNVYEHLPEFLSNLLSNFNDKLEKDIVLLSSLAVLSGCFPRIHGKYDRKARYLNIYLAIVGPAGSGKSAAYWSRAILDKVEQEYEKQGKFLFFPADTSFAALIEKLATNDGKGILFAFEIDTLTQNFSKEWGNISALLRQAFEHEKYESMRKEPTNVSILNRPALSILLTGTPKQIISLIPDTEDGLFSRFLFYNNDLNPTWHNVFPENEEGETLQSLDDLIEPFKQQAVEIISAYKDDPDKMIEFKLTKAQGKKLNNYFSLLSDKNKDATQRDAIATIRRLGLICFRIAGVLTALRQYQATPTELLCCDEDFETAITLCGTFYVNAYHVARQLPAAKISSLKPQHRIFLSILPDGEFTRKAAEAAGLKHDIKPDTVEKYLKDLQPEYITKLGHNKYVKV